MMKMSVKFDQVKNMGRRDWGMVKPVQKTFKSKKDYNRYDKSWKDGE